MSGKHDETHDMGTFNAQGKDELTSDELDAGHKPRHCTDIICLMLFLLGLAGVYSIMTYAKAHGDLRRLYHGFDYNGNLCGVDQNYTNKPFLYWCASPAAQVSTYLSSPVYGASTILDMKHPICVAACPTDTTTTHSCFQSRDAVAGAADPVTGTFVERVTYNFQLVQDAPTTTFVHRYCLPKTPELAAQVQIAIDQSPLARVAGPATQVYQSWQALLASAVLAVLLGYVYLYLLDKFAAPLVYSCLFVASILPLVAGACCIHSARVPDVGHILTTGHSTWDMIIGICCVVFGSLVLLISCCCRHSIELAIGCVEAACDCMFDMPSLLLEPLFNVIAKSVLIIFAGYGLAWLISCGEVKRHDITQYVPGGISRTFKYDQNELGYIAFYIFMTIWVLEIMSAMAQFVLAYSTQLWFFKEYEGGKKRVPAFPLCRAYFLGLHYHLGTLAFGALLVTILRVLRIIVGFIAKQAKSEGNHALTCLASCCSCCLSCFDRFLRFVNKNAYMCVAIDSSPFCVAAQRAFRIIASEITAISTLNGACWVFQLAGVASITGSGVYLTWLLTQTASIFTDPTSPAYIEDCVIVSSVAGVICFIIAHSFMSVFDTVADTILFCWAFDRQFRIKEGKESKDYAPPRLKRLLNEHRD